MVIAFFILLGLAVVAQLTRYQVFAPAVAVPPAALPNDPGARGAIVDRNGLPLVVNRFYFQLTATPSLITTDEQRREVAQQLQDLLGMPAEQTYATLTTYADKQWAVLSDAITLEQANRLTQLQRELASQRASFPLRHVGTDARAKRYYPQAELTSHVLGFVRADIGGITGVEEYYNGFLLENGAGLLSKNTLPIADLGPSVLRFVPSSVGKDLILTLDATVQWIIREELQRGLDEFKAVSGTVIVMDPATGAIYGMVNLPDYDPNRYETLSPEQHGLFTNQAIGNHYEPGSVFKIITMGAALDADLMTPTTIFTDTGTFTIGSRIIFNSTRTASGRVTATDALGFSLNTITAELAATLGPDRFYRYVRLFGFGEATNVDLSGEINGIIKTPRDRNWSMADLGTNSFGQGIATTPLQMLNATAAIANNGTLLQPYIVQSRIANDQAQITEPVVVRQALRPQSAHDLAAMMAAIVSDSNSLASVPGYRVAGKSGTAQIPSPEGYVQDETIVSFVGFAPADDPQFVMLVKLDRPDPTLNQWAGQTAAPVFSRIAQRLLHHFSVPPDELRLAATSPAGE